MGTTPAPEIRVKITGEDTGVAAAIKELSTQLQQLKRTQDDAGSSAQKLGAAERGAGSSMREAREGADCSPKRPESISTADSSRSSRDPRHSVP